MPKNPVFETVEITKLVHGGQGLGQLKNGQKAFVWNALPGEKVNFRVTKKRKDFLEGIATEIINQSSQRTQPRDELYLSTSPWQIISEDAETSYKTEILEETFRRAGIDFGKKIDTTEPPVYWHYRNKMEYSFYGDDDGLHLALYNRGTHSKQVVAGSSIARPEIDELAQKITEVLNVAKVRAGDLKTLILRCNQNGDTVAALFVKAEKFERIEQLENLCKGLVVVYSNPKSPASVRTQDLYVFGDISLYDRLNDTEISYDVFSFFQVNVPVFKQALESVKSMIGSLPAVDMYSGVGAIGAGISTVDKLVEVDAANVKWLRKNTQNRPKVEVVHASSEKSLELIDSGHVLIVDPPRAGLHTDLIEKINQEKPPKVVYLSCNPSTQARDIALLAPNYRVQTVEMYNFFPRTPHIESLVLLVRQ